MVVKDINSFALNIRYAVRGAWTGVMDFLAFNDNMILTIQKGYEEAWREGAKMCGIGPEDRTNAEQAALDQEIIRDQGYIAGFYDYIRMGARGEGLLRRSLTRSELWINRYNAVVSLAKSMACADEKLKWHLGATQEHCEDCSRYAGRVHRASIWARYATLPQSRDLECRGFRCQCQLLPTDEPAWPGRPPAPTGGGLFR